MEGILVSMAHCGMCRIGHGTGCLQSRRQLSLLVNRDFIGSFLCGLTVMSRYFCVYSAIISLPVYVLSLHLYFLMFGWMAIVIYILMVTHSHAHPVFVWSSFFDVSWCWAVSLKREFCEILGEFLNGPNIKVHSIFDCSHIQAWSEYLLCTWSQVESVEVISLNLCMRWFLSVGLLKVGWAITFSVLQTVFRLPDQPVASVEWRACTVLWGGGDFGFPSSVGRPVKKITTTISSISAVWSCLKTCGSCWS